MYSGGLFHCYILDESICHFRVVGSTLSLLLYFDGNPVSTDKTPHYVASDLVLQCLLTTILRVSRLDCVNLQVGTELRVYQMC